MDEKEMRQQIKIIIMNIRGVKWEIWNFYLWSKGSFNTELVLLKRRAVHPWYGVRDNRQGANTTIEESVA